MLGQKRHTNGQQAHKEQLNMTNQRNADENHNVMLSHMLEWLSSKTPKISSVDEDMEKREPLCTVGGMETGAAPIGNSMEVPQAN